MIDLLRHIILCITAASLFCAVSLSLLPEGALKEVIRMGTGLVLILSLAVPLWQSLPSALADLRPKISLPEQQETEKLYQQTVIKQVEAETAQYVVQQAEALDISCTASATATADENGVVSITAIQVITDQPVSDGRLASLRTQLRQELGITDGCIRIQ